MFFNGLEPFTNLTHVSKKQIVFTCFHYIHIGKTSTPPGGHFHDWTNIVTSLVFIRKTAPPTGGHIFQWTGITFELNQHIIKTNILTNFELDRGIIETNLLAKFHEDRTRNVASRVSTNQMWTDGRRTDSFMHIELMTVMFIFESYKAVNNK
ncbi:hypothetical protein DPMN_014934 [Dreissena polymorpha]|uniref:Uncharacterized protein n=1 Tax=Dreissena polymorpha TaxID=45954 RepID=A0A9D4NAL2_DREPO|nr:hypothetical protein DPMN_014934 [Dreissena polymorpha]